MHGLDIGPKVLIPEQQADETLKKYWELAEQPVEDGNRKTYFSEKKGILYRKYYGGQNEDGVIQLVVPKDLREKH